MLVFLIGFAVWQPIRQAQAMEEFTQEAPTPLPVVNLAENEMAASQLIERLELFRSDLSDDKKEAIIKLNPEDVNLAIATFEPLKELRGTFHVKSMEDGHANISICYQLNRLPEFLRKEKGGADHRYLVGTMVARPLLSKGELAISVDDLEVPGSEVPEGFMGHFSTLRIFEQYLKHDDIGPVMMKLTSASIEDGNLVLARVPGDPVPDIVSDQDFKKSGGRIMLFIGGAALVFLLLAGTVLFLAYRTQLRKIQAQEANSQLQDDPSSEDENPEV